MITFPFISKLHLQKHQNITENCEIVSIAPKEGEALTFLMSQHAGEPAVPIVNVGDKVLLGEKIAKSEGELSANIHSSVSGTVKSIAQVLDPKKGTTQAIVIESDGQMEEYSPTEGIADYATLTRDKFIDIIKEAGIVELDGSGFPAYVKLNPPTNTKVEYILVSGVESESYCTSNCRCMLEKPQNIKDSLKLILRFFPDARVIFAIEAGKNNLIELYSNIFKDTPQITVVAQKPRYPHTSEKIFIKTCVNREVPQGKAPIDIGVILINASTLAAIDLAVRNGKPLTTRTVTLSGCAIEKPGNYEVCVGMSYQSIIDALGGFKLPPKKVISGDALTGHCFFNLNTPITKNDSVILALSTDETQICNEQPCIRCSRCAECCQIGLQPFELNAKFLVADLEGFKESGGQDCIECAACSYICPSKRHLAQSIRSAKKAISNG